MFLEIIDIGTDKSCRYNMIDDFNQFSRVLSIVQSDKLLRFDQKFCNLKKTKFKFDFIKCSKEYMFSIDVRGN